MGTSIDLRFPTSTVLCLSTSVGSSIQSSFLQGEKVDLKKEWPQMHIKSTVRYFTPTKMVIIKKTIISVDEDVGSWNPHELLVEVKNVEGGVEKEKRKRNSFQLLVPRP